MQNYSVILFCLLFGCFYSCENSIPDENDSPNWGNEKIKSENNILKNGSFEKWLSAPVSWSYNNMNVEPCSVAFEGNCSACLSSPKKGETAKLYQRIAVTPGHLLKLYHHYYFKEGNNNGARMYCYFRTNITENISNEALKDVFGKEELNIIRGGGYGLSYFPFVAGEWNVFNYNIRVPKNATYLVFEIHCYYRSVLYVDDCYVIDLNAV